MTGHHSPPGSASVAVADIGLGDDGDFRGFVSGVRCAGWGSGGHSQKGSDHKLFGLYEQTGYHFSFPFFFLVLTD